MKIKCFSAQFHYSLATMHFLELQFNLFESYSMTQNLMCNFNHINFICRLLALCKKSYATLILERLQQKSCIIHVTSQCNVSFQFVATVVSPFLTITIKIYLKIDHFLGSAFSLPNQCKQTTSYNFLNYRSNYGTANDLFT